MTKKLLTVVGGQFGSEAKGHVAAQLAARELREGQQVWAVRVAGHNAGHTSYDKEGRPFALRTIPCMAVVDPLVQCFIAAGSEVNIEVLESEIEMLEEAGHMIRNRLYLDPELTLIEDRHFEQEGGMREANGSTGKGVGAARAERAMRTARRLKDRGHAEYRTFSSEEWFQYDRVPDNVTIILEGTQGFGLGSHAGFYPFCTSSDCRSIDFLAMAGINPTEWDIDYQPWVVCRTFPIRVAGNSGPLKYETDWETLERESDGYIQPERTTVTKLVRRIGCWDEELVRRAIAANGGKHECLVALTFADYLDPRMKGKDQFQDFHQYPAVKGFVDDLEKYANIGMMTTGPDTAIWFV